ncbi:uncharacterized protein LOC132301164 [Cornus florida]|uniref:uncharacterized protein LOC132301164 n=1 Tax=Cornus florida TaxID=4283 RepID=UPI00289B89CA|nr:uncharacterized protein LOC132301164 [Cornus florida]
MDYRVLAITVLSAKGLTKVNTISDMDVYVTGLISGDQRTEQRTPTNSRGSGKSPEWNHRMKFSVAESDLATPTDHFVRLNLRSKRKVLGDRDIGYVTIRLHELLEKAGRAGERFMEHKVRDPTGKTTDAKLKFCYRFDEKFVAPPPEKFYDFAMYWCAQPPPGVAPPHRPPQLYVFAAETDAIKYGVERMQKKHRHSFCLV